MTAAANPLGLSPLEIASHLVPGRAAPAPRLPRYDGSTPRSALEGAVCRVLSRDPCVVSFSGGRDSSAALALAVHVARRERLELPIPVTLRFPGAEQTNEASWQEEVVRHLGLADWERIDMTDELDMLGPYARRVLNRCGLLWPANCYVHEPILECAAGGSLVTGVDGDGLLSSWRWQYHADVAAGRRRRRPRDLLLLAHPMSPAPVRRAIGRVRGSLGLPHGSDVPEWMRPWAARRIAAAERREVSEEPFFWKHRVKWYAARRYVELARGSFELMSAAHGVAVTHLFLDPGFLAALAEHSRFGPGDRTSAMRELFGDLLPVSVVARADKARFGAPFAAGYSRRFISRWSGEGVDPDVVDPAVLARVWREEADPGRQSMLLLHSIWLGSSADRA